MISGLIENCGYCGTELEQSDEGIWLDKWENAVCPYRAGDAIHVPYDPDPPDRGDD